MKLEKILVIEDDPTLQETLGYYLTQQGYDVKTAGDGEMGVKLVQRFSPDLLVLDLMIPKLDGFEVCKIVRNEMTIPILILTARDGEFDRVLGLEIGADDYLTKPFSMREFLARIKALIRRVKLDRGTETSDMVGRNEILQVANLQINTKRREVNLEGLPVSLKPKEYELLLFIVMNSGKALSREFILDSVWGWDFDGGRRTVDVHMRWLREKIEKNPGNPKRIVTVQGVGYRFEG